MVNDPSFHHFQERPHRRSGRDEGQPGPEAERQNAGRPRGRPAVSSAWGLTNPPSHRRPPEPPLHGRLRMSDHETTNESSNASSTRRSTSPPPRSRPPSTTSPTRRSTRSFSPIPGRLFSSSPRRRSTIGPIRRNGGGPFSRRTGNTRKVRRARSRARKSIPSCR